MLCSRSDRECGISGGFWASLLGEAAMRMLILTCSVSYQLRCRRSCSICDTVTRFFRVVNVFGRVCCLLAVAIVLPRACWPIFERGKAAPFVSLKHLEFQAWETLTSLSLAFFGCCLFFYEMPSSGRLRSMFEMRVV